ncbi:MAG: RNA 2',3'-cyclic phosphodiesterase [Candidatus Aminicenantales bacterium]
MRTFIAIDLAPSIKDELSHFIQKLASVSSNIKWVKKNGMHLTLKFLGEIEEDKVEEIKSCLSEISKDHAPFSLQLKGTGSFPPGKKKPRVLWIGIEENKNLIILQSDLEKKLTKLGFPPEKRTFRPHLTLGRVKTVSQLGKIMAYLEKNREKSFGHMEVNKIIFFRSILKPTGAEYQALAEFELS